jgi:Cu+-exporting ATPase
MKTGKSLARLVVAGAQGLVAKEVRIGADSVIYTCPMHPEVRENAPGKCPKCGMSLEPEA